METTEQQALEHRAKVADLRVGRTLATIVIASAFVMLYHLRRGLAIGRKKAADKLGQSPDLCARRPVTDEVFARVDGAALPAAVRL
jgi:hypothetical protein